MIRAWIILSCLVLSTLFKFFDKYGKEELAGLMTRRMGFIIDTRTLNIESWTYYAMEHLIAIAIAGVILIRDNTPRALIWVYFWILIADFIHYLLFYRDEGIGFNLAKVLVFGACFIYYGYRNTFNR